MNHILAPVILAVTISYFTLGQEQSKSPTSANAVPASAQTGSAGQAELAVRQVEAACLEALAKGDTTALDRFWADEYSFTAPDGRVVDKENYLALLRSGSLKYESLKIAGLKVRVYGDAALASGRVTFKGRIAAHELNGQDRFLTVYVKRQGRWQQVATQAARIAQPVSQ